jgi:hypothetical protein
MATHKEKDDMIKALKDKVKELEQFVKSRTVEKDLTEVGFSIVRENGIFYLIELKFDIASGNAKMVNKIEMSKDYAIALFKGKKFLVENIMLKYTK